MKSMSIDNLLTFPFPTPPDTQSMIQALKILTHLGALEKDDPATGNKKRITKLGRTLAAFPVQPRFAKM